jgi:hypothetical protein
MWCIVRYILALRTFNSVILLLHFFVPFLLNIILGCVVVHTFACHRATAQPQQTYQHKLRVQVHKLKHILISPMIFTLLALPRLIISFLSVCMKSSRDSWLFFFGYLTSFVSPIFIFFVLVLVFDTYKKVFNKTIKHIT